jgi:hypothetical protein
LAKREGSPAKPLLPGSEKAMQINKADVAELVDARDLKSLDGNVVWVRVPPPAPALYNRNINYITIYSDLHFSAVKIAHFPKVTPG